MTEPAPGDERNPPLIDWDDDAIYVPLLDEGYDVPWDGD